MPDDIDPMHEDDMSKPPPFFPTGHERLGRESDREVRVEIEGFYDFENPAQTPQRVIVLSDDKGRTVRMIIGAFEWLSIQMAKENDYPDRPFTHDLIRNIIDRLGYTVDKIVIDDLWQEVFYAKLYLRKGDEIVEIDSRPSDAIAVAVRYNAAMYMAESVLEMTDRSDLEDDA
ncbi:MAG: bifunctional nuclease family protein [Fimbriimonadia bacterium]|jgi:hypothetical protein